MTSEIKATRCACDCHCGEAATTTDGTRTSVCDPCSDYYTTDDASVICSREQDSDRCRHCGQAIKWGHIQTGQPGVSNWREGSCACGGWVLTERGGAWDLAEAEIYDDEEDEMANKTNEQTWHIAPEDQGQIVEVAYAIEGELERILRRTTNRSDASITLAIAHLADLEGDFEPWNGADNLRRLTWHCREWATICGNGWA